MKSLASRLLPLAALAALVACSEDVPAGDPGGMGARDLTPPAEVGSEPAAEILERTNTPGFADSTGAGAPGTTGTLRDSTAP